MADNLSVNPVTAGGATVATDDISSVHYQRNKLSLGADGTATDAIGISAGLDSSGTGVQAVGVVGQLDDTATATVTENQFAPVRISSRRALLVEGVSGGTAVAVNITSASVSGAVAHDAVGTGTNPVIVGGRASAAAPTGVSADGDAAYIWVLRNGAQVATGDVAHDAADDGLPQKVGYRAINALPSAVANADRANGVSDLWGRQLTGHIDPAMQVHKSFNATTQQTGADVWSPTAGKKIAITSIVIGSYGTTAGRLILWFGDNADTTYTAGTDQLVLAASFAPSSTSKPGLVFTPAVPVFCTTADRELHITTDAAMSVDVAVEGYEW